MKPWKTILAAAFPQSDFAPLQWGHADEGVEGAGCVAITKAAIEKLQWGHADEGVEGRRDQGRDACSRYASMGPRR